MRPCVDRGVLDPPARPSTRPERSRTPDAAPFGSGPPRHRGPASPRRRGHPSVSARRRPVPGWRSRGFSHRRTPTMSEPPARIGEITSTDDEPFRARRPRAGEPSGTPEWSPTSPGNPAIPSPSTGITKGSRPACPTSSDASATRQPCSGSPGTTRTSPTMGISSTAHPRRSPRSAHRRSQSVLVSVSGWAVGIDAVGQSGG